MLAFVIQVRQRSVQRDARNVHEIDGRSRRAQRPQKGASPARQAKIVPRELRNPPQNGAAASKPEKERQPDDEYAQCELRVVRQRLEPRAGRCRYDIAGARNLRQAHLPGERKRGKEHEQRVCDAGQRALPVQKVAAVRTQA